LPDADAAASAGAPGTPRPARTHAVPPLGRPCGAPHGTGRRQRPYQRRSAVPAGVLPPPL